MADPSSAWSWQPTERPSVGSLELAPNGLAVASPLAAELAGSASIEAVNLPLIGVCPAVVSIPLGRLKFKTTSFTFPQPLALVPLGDRQPPKESLPVADSATAARPAGLTVTRLKPPHDAVKLE